MYVVDVPVGCTHRTIYIKREYCKILLYILDLMPIDEPPYAFHFDCFHIKTMKEIQFHFLFYKSYIINAMVLEFI